MNKAIKNYSIDKSFLYKLRNRGKLAEMLGLPLSYFRGNYKQNIIYTEFTKDIGKKKREIQSPCKKLKKIQKRILELLSKINIPDWLISGKKGKSYIDNAIFHKKYSYVLTMDISDFYQSCQRNYIYKMFKEKFLMENDIAGIMTDLTALQNCLPTGAPTSQLIAFWTHQDIFEEIQMLAENNNMKFTLYVDDMTFSSNKRISSKILLEVNSLLKRSNLKLKARKTKQYNKNDFKTITGVAIDVNDSLKIPNHLRKEIIDAYIKFKNLDGIERMRIGRTILGKISSARQIEPNVFKEIHRQVLLKKQILIAPYDIKIL